MNKIGPKIFPCMAKEVPTPVAINRKVPQKKESPTPARGHIKDVLILSIAVTSNIGSSLFSSSIAVTTLLFAKKPVYYIINTEK